MAKSTGNTDETREVQILTEIYEYAKLDPSFIKQLQEVFDRDRDPEKVMEKLKGIVE